MTVQAGLCRTCSETTLLVIPGDGSFLKVRTEGTEIVQRIKLNTQDTRQESTVQNITKRMHAHGEETAQSEPMAPFMKSGVCLAGHMRPCIISAEISERSISFSICCPSLF